MPIAAVQRDAPKGNVTCKVGAFPGGRIKSYELPVGSTYRDALKAAQLQTDGEIDLRVNGGHMSSLAGVVNENDQILVFSNIRGN